MPPRHSRRRRVPLPAGLTALAIAGLAAAPVVLADPVGPPIAISEEVPPRDAALEEGDADLAYNPSADQYLAVWEGDTAVEGEDEIFGRILDGGGLPISPVIRLSTMGPDGDTGRDALDPAVAYNGAVDEYLVVWEGDDAAGSLADDEFEIFGQRVTSGGAEVGADDFRISDMGPDGGAGFDARNPDAAYDPVSDQYLVVWQGADDAGALVAGEEEIYGQRLDASGAQIGVNDLRISAVGADGDPARDARSPAVAHNAVDGQFLVVWGADALATDNEIEVFGQRLGANGSPQGADDLRISDMGADGDADRDGEEPAVAHLTTSNEYLVVWQGDDLAGDDEIFGQRLGGAAGDARGVNDARISDLGPDGVPGFGAESPEVGANPRAEEFMVAWTGSDDVAPLVPGKREVFGQRIGASGAETGSNDFRVSVTETAANPAVGASSPTPTVANTRRNEYLTAWEADGDVPPQVDGETQVVVRRSAAGPATSPPPPICAAAPAPPTPQTAGRVTLSIPQLKINQRIYAAAIARARAITRWLDEGIETRDLCAGGITAAALDARITTGPGANGPLDASARPDPRPIPTAARVTKPGATFTLSAKQLGINQRIAARAVREANALQRRLGAGLSGGDVDDGAVTAAAISTGIIITGATPSPAPPPPTTTDVRPAGRTPGARVVLSAEQLRINQRIGQAAIRRLNATRTTLLTGLTGARFAPGTITAVDLAPGVAP